MNEEQKEEYLANNGLVCPFCDHNDLDTSQLKSMGESGIKQTVACLGCDEEWTDFYTLTDVE